MDNHYLVNVKYEGIVHDIAHDVTASSNNDAEDWFLDAKERLLDVNNWKRYSGTFTADFRLTDAHSKPVARPARKGDHIRLGNSDKWAIVEAIEYDDYPDIDMETLALRLYPLTEAAECIEKHDDRAIGTFVIERHATRLSAKYYGNAGKLNDLSAGMPGEWNDLTDAQWHSLVKGVLV